MDESGKAVPVAKGMVVAVFLFLAFVSIDLAMNALLVLMPI
ncbi:MAG: hypothetical protein AABY93_03745 [Bacteroidota bacterium]